MKMYLLALTLILVNSALGMVSNATWFYNSLKPLVIGHQGNCGHYPEFSSAAIADAFLNGADFLEVTV